MRCSSCKVHARVQSCLAALSAGLLLQVAIVGSSNINDRSLLGMRDSEVNVVIEDPEQPYSMHFQG